MEKLLYGVAYYDEYIPYDRLDKDIELMKTAGINVVRIAESTWSTLEPQNGVFDFTSIDRVMNAMHASGIKVIIGTPTYAVPTWMVRQHPDILALTSKGQNKYGPRQNMDITNPNYLFYAERMIRALMLHVKDHPSIIGYQVDNETKHYDVSGQRVLDLFVAFMKNRYTDIEEMNERLGLDYWSNRINAWEDFPNLDTTINASLSGEYETFRRNLVTDFLSWQAEIVQEYKQDNQFITQNFDFEWRGFSFGCQPDVDHFEAAKAMTIAGADIYHPGQDQLTGCEIAFGGDLTRSLKKDNYLVIETQAQGQPAWLPYPGQLRLQAFSHLASGANMVAYWHWHSIHNSFETYWKGLLSQDFEPSPTFNEASTIGNDFSRLSKKLVNLKKDNRVAILISNEALSALNWFRYFYDMNYNDILRNMYDALYKMNVACDFIYPESEDLEQYDMIVVAPLYAASDKLLKRLNTYVESGGHVVYGIRSGYCDEKVKVRNGHQPGIINEACGIYYSQHTDPKDTKIQSNIFSISDEDLNLTGLIELIEPKGAKVLAKYNHPVWGEYAAITHNTYGSGSALYIGCCPTEKVYSEVFSYLLKENKQWTQMQEYIYPIIVRRGVNDDQKGIIYFFNYSGDSKSIIYAFEDGLDLLENEMFHKGDKLSLPAWGVKIVELLV